MPKDRRYSSAAWKKTRRAVLERDNYTCQIRKPTCETAATAVDHIIPSADGGSFYDPNNLRAACPSCNSRRAAQQKASDGWRRSPTRITLVTGPPCAGKSTYVQQHHKPGDLIIDYDTLAQAVGSPHHHDHPTQLRPAITKARGSLLTLIRRGDAPTISHAWIVSSDPNAPTMFPHHNIIELDPGIDEALRRATQDRPKRWQHMIRNWYRTREEIHTGGSRDW